MFDFAKVSKQAIEHVLLQVGIVKVGDVYSVVVNGPRQITVTNGRANSVITVNDQGTIEGYRKEIVADQYIERHIETQKDRGDQWCYPEIR